MKKKFINDIYNQISGYKKRKFLSFLSFASKLDYFFIILGIIFSFIQGIIFISFAFNFAGVFQSFNSNDLNLIRTNLNTNSLLFLYFGGGIFVCSFIGYYSFSFSGKNMSQSMKILYFKRIWEKDSDYFDSIKISELNSKFIENIKDFSEGFSEKLNYFFYNIGVILGGLGLAFYSGWLVSLLSLSLSPILLVGLIFYLKYQKKLKDLNTESYLKAGSITEETFSMIKIVKSYNAEKHEINNFKNALSLHEKVLKKFSLIIGLLNAIFNFAFFLMYASGLLIGTLVINNQVFNHNTGLPYNLGDFLVIFLSIVASSYSLTQLGPNIITLTTSIKVFEEVDKFINSKNKIDINSINGIKPKDLKGKIEFKNVTFSFPSKKDKIILKNISFVVNIGESVAFVGESGCGKSTIFQLIERYYDVDEGEIFIDDINIKEYNLFYLRNLIGLVSQESFLFGSTIRNNLKLGIPDEEMIQNDDKLFEALKRANAYEFVNSLDNGLDTYVGTDGSQFSGGQKQRLSIARVILKNPKIYLLDEATSALDRENEMEIQNNLEKISKNQTIITIAHRLKTIEKVDKIYVFKNGEIIESGNHKELLSLKKEYSNLIKLQNMVEDNNREKIEIEYLRSIKSHQSKIVEKRFTFINGISDLMKKKKEEDWITISSFLEKEKKYFILGFVFTFFNGLIFPLFGIFYSEILINLVNIILNINNQTILNNLQSTSNILIIIMFSISVGSFVFNFLSFTIFNFIGEKYSNKLRGIYFECLIYKDSKFFDKEKNKPGELNSQLLNDCKEINSLITIYLSLIIQNIVTIITGLIIAFYSSWRLALSNFLVIPLLALSGLIDLDIRDESNNTKGDGNKENDSNSLLNECLNNVKNIWALSAHKKFIYFYYNSLKAENNKIIKVKLFKTFWFAFSKFSVFGSYALLFYLGGYVIFNFGETIQNVNRAIFTLVFTAYGIGAASQFIANLNKTKLAKENIEKKLNKKNGLENNVILEKYTKSKPDNNRKNTIINLNNFKGKIQFIKVSFRYPNRAQLVLDNVSFTINPGQKVAFVGNSGCGKSTIIQLLYRFYEIESGNIFIDNINIKDLDLTFLRSLYGIVSQETRLFNGNIYYNIIYNLENISEPSLINASKKSLAYDFISKKDTNKEEEKNKYDKLEPNKVNKIEIDDVPKGFYFNVGNKGEKLSGGQKQRVCIARTLLRNPKIFLFDEATSALDNQSEKLIQENLDEISKNFTSIFIAHRLSTIKNSDKIFVLNKGKIVEEGNYKQLLKKKGFFFNLNN